MAVPASSGGQEDILRKIMSEVTESLTADLREVLSVTLEKQISSALTKALLESEFYRRISDDMRGGLKKIYKEINAAAQNSQQVDVSAVPDKEHADKLFHEASEQLSAVLQQTEQATDAIMEVVEKHLETQEEASSILHSIAEGSSSEEQIARLAAINGELGEDLNNIMLSLSFQDLTGQRIKRAVAALKEIESTVVEMYLSTGLLIQAYEDGPDRDLTEIEAETRKKVSGLKDPSVLNSPLKGPEEGASQQQIDDLLAQLGM